MRTHKKQSGIKPNVIMFYIGYAAFIFSVMTKRVLALGEIANNIYTVCLTILLLTCIFSILKMPRKKMLLFAGVTILVITTRFITNSNLLLSLWLLIVASKDVDFDSIVKYDLRIKIPLLILVSGLYFAGLTYINLHFRNGIVRHSMGFSNPNVFSTYIMSILAEILYLRRKKINWLDIILSIIAMLIIDYYANSRTQIVCIIGLIIVFFLYNHIDIQKVKESVSGRIISFFNRNIFIILMVFSIFFATIYTPSSNSFLQTINNLTSGRVQAASDMLTKYDVTLFGQKVEIIYGDQAKATGQEVQNLDNAYIYFFLEFGVITSICAAVFMNKYMKHATQKKNIVGYIMMIYLIGGLMEHFCLEPQLNIFLLYFGQVAYGSVKYLKSKDQKQEE